MGPDEEDRLRLAFAEVEDLPPERREAAIRARHDGDPPFRDLLLRMARQLDVTTTDDELLPPVHTSHRVGALREALAGGPGPGPVDADLLDLEGRILAGRYAVAERIGAGGAGVVHAGVDRVTGEAVAIKVLHRPPARGREEARREASVLRLLRLPGVVRLLDDGLVDGRPYLVCERVTGAPFPGAARPAPWEAIARTTVALLEALDRVHRAGIVHADLKPANVLVRADGLPVLLDLGIARPRRAPPRAARVEGTLSWIAPEQLASGRALVQSDLHAVGLMVLRALPEGPTPAADPVPPAAAGALSADVSRVAAPPRVRRALAALLARDPDARPASAADALVLLGEGRAGPRLGLGPGRLDAEALRDLFLGPDRLFHLREDGARALQGRTGGRPQRVAAELDAWSRAGLGWWEGDRYRVRRADLERLAADGRPLAPPAGSAPAVPLEADAVELLAAVDLAGGGATTDLLATALGADARRLEERLAALVRRGLLERDAGAEDGEGGPAWRVRALPAAVRRRLEDAGSLHARFAAALAPEDERRLFHLAAAGRRAEVVRAAGAVVHARLAAGDVERSRAVLAVALAAADFERPDDTLFALLVDHLAMALLQGGPGALEETLHHLGRLPAGPDVDRLERTARAALAAVAEQPLRALDFAPDPSEPATPAELRCRISVRVYAARRASDAALRAEAARLEAHAADTGSAEAAAGALGARAWLASKEAPPEEAAERHLACAAATPYAATRANLTLNAANALLEAGRAQAAEAHAAGVLPFARAHRLLITELRAERVLRRAAYLRGADLEPDPELAEAAREAGVGHLAANVALVEAAFAWRRGRRALVRDLAQIARDAAPSRADQRLLARGLLLATLASPDDAEASRLLDDAEAAPARYALPVAALVASTHPTLVPRAQALVARLREAWPVADPRLRLEILSLEEVLEGVFGPNSRDR